MYKTCIYEIKMAKMKRKSHIKVSENCAINSVLTLTKIWPPTLKESGFLKM